MTNRYVLIVLGAALALAFVAYFGLVMIWPPK